MFPSLSEKIQTFFNHSIAANKHFRPPIIAFKRSPNLRDLKVYKHFKNAIIHAALPVRL